MNETTTPRSTDALIAQLKEVNERSRTYTRQFWQVPFAYVAGAGVVLAQVAEKPTASKIALITVGVIGGFVVVYLWQLRNPIRRAFKAIRKLEKDLQLSPRAKWTPGHLYTFIALTAATASVSLLAGLYLAVCR